MMNLLVVDVGGSHVKILASGHTESQKTVSGSTMTARQMTDEVLMMAEGWEFDVVSIGFPGQVMHGRPALEPRHLGPGCRRGENADAFAGGFRLWGDDAFEM